MPAMAAKGQASQKGASSGRKISLKGTIPVKVMSLEAVFHDFTDRGGVLPDERDKFYSYVMDLSPFVQKEVLHLMTSRIPPFENEQIKIFEADAAYLERSLNSYLRYTAKSIFSSIVSFERFIPHSSVAARMRLALQLRPKDKQDGTME